MNILVLNGSPKGDNSITLQTMIYLKNHFRNHRYIHLNVGARINSYVNDWSQAASVLEKADLIIFSYPVYTFLVPSQLHRFVELMKTSGINFHGKWMTQITTSKHFYDSTAHRFIEDNCADMGFKIIKGLSADMDDLTTSKGRTEAKKFFRYVLWSIDNNLDTTMSPNIYKPTHRTVHETPSAKRRISANASMVQVSESIYTDHDDSEVVIVADLAPDDKQLDAMIKRFRNTYDGKTRLVNIHDFAFKGGCLSCFNCATDGTCIYTDGFDKLLRAEIQTGSAIVIAFSIKDHSMGSIFKTYDDRQFCNGHRTVTMGRSFGYLISGNLSREENLRTVIEARCEVGGNFLAGIATDEFNPDAEIDKLALRLRYAIDYAYVQPSNFYGVGGRKIFRDLIWLMQGMMKADHRFFKEHAQYDFPQKRVGTMAKMYFVGALLGNEKLKSKMNIVMNEAIVAPYKDALHRD